jgi:hypothetical protein
LKNYDSKKSSAYFVESCICWHGGSDPTRSIETAAVSLNESDSVRQERETSPATQNKCHFLVIARRFKEKESETQFSFFGENKINVQTFSNPGNIIRKSHMFPK